MAKIVFAALDGAIANFGIARMAYDTQTGQMEVVSLHLNKTAKNKSKQARVSSDDLRRSQEQARFVRDHTSDCAIIFGEVPSGGQDSRAARAFGIVTGLYASIQQPFQEVTPAEVKMAALGTATASKVEMIEWATEKFPTAPWLRAQKNGAKFKAGDLTADNEHLADAVAVAYAGVQTTSFKLMISMISAMGRAA
jgi:Holliday junction resolvasome RuvABC endonuclease subunit